MRLYLSSNYIPTPDDFFRLIGKAPRDVRLAIIPHARDCYIERIRQQYVEKAVRYFQELGVQGCEVFELRSYPDGASDELQTILARYDVVWASGGNAFMLLFELRRTGCDTAIRNLLENDTLVYSGESAGQIVASPSMRGFELIDKPTFAKVIHWDGMALVDKCIIPHADDPRYQPAVGRIREQQPDALLLKNTQAYIVNSDRVGVASGNG